ncbi:hypothetical protein AB0K18_09795 [Nonomuraea sp. NPDC049421]|uniref:hypothetical protein n=1 Tax=Nonomuraea sp. NPDC049421 TaxID=3155275 RepID=UPI00341D6227
MAKALPWEIGFRQPRLNVKTPGGTSDMDRIVLGSRGLSALPRAVVGSVAG